jgi:predicted transcriptional regulator
MKGNDVKNLRKKLNLTQVEFAEFIGVDRRTIINYEQGEPIPKSRQVYFTTLMEEFESKNSLPKTEILNVEKGLPNHNTEIVEIEKKIIFRF